MKYDDLKNYVYFVLQVETIKYQLEQCIRVSQERKEKMCIPRYIPTPEKKKVEKLDIESVGMALLISFIMVAIFATLLENFIDVAYQAVFAFTILLCGILLIAVYNIECNRIDKINYENEQEYNIEKAIESERLRQELTQKEKQEQFIAILYAMAEEINKILLEIYDLNIIHSSYRGIMSVSVIYQLLDIKICYKLEGTDGAYNMCNTEQYRKQVLIKIDTILENVEEIKNTQYALYEMMRNTKKILEAILLCNYVENVQINKISNDVNLIKFFLEIEYIKNCKDSFIKNMSDILKDHIK